MESWKSPLKADPTEWLLEETQPSIRYFALRWLSDLPENDPQVIAAGEAVANSAPVQKILARQRPAGYWGSDPNPHSGCRKHLLLLNWLGYHGNGAVHRAMDLYLAQGLDEQGACFVDMPDRRLFMPCHGANLLRLMFWNGYGDDSRAGRLLDWLLSIQQPDGALPCVSKRQPFNCLWATADVLRLFEALPAAWLTPDVMARRNKIVELFLESGFSRYNRRKLDPPWFQFGFPLQWDSDLLEVLELIAPFVSPQDPRLQSGVEHVLSKQDAHGRWPCEKYPRGGKWMQAYVEFEPLGQPSKWVTLHALKMLKRLSAEKAVSL